MKDTMILKDGTTIELEAGASLGAIQVSESDRSAMLRTSGEADRGESGRDTDPEWKWIDRWNIQGTWCWYPKLL